jgi:predicted permease
MIMNSIIYVAPVIAIVLIGYLSIRFKLLSGDVADGLAGFVFNIALPAYIFRTIVRWGIPKDLTNTWELFASYYAGALIILLIAMLISRYAFEGTQAEQSMFGVGASHSNIVLLGLPVALYVLGSKLTLPILLIVATHGVVMALLLGVVLRIRMGKSGEIFTAIGQTLLDHLKNPVLIALIAGVLYAAFDAPKMPKEVDTVLSLLGRATVPCALFAMGGMLVRYKIHGNLAPAVAVCAIKLAAFPAIVYALAKPLFGLPMSWVWVVVVLAAMPTSFNMHKLMKRSQRGSEASSTAIALSTILSAVGIVVLVYIMRN